MSKDLDRIPRNIMRIVDDGKNPSMLETIIDYLTAEEGTVHLTMEQEEKLNRLQKVDELFNMGRYTNKELLNLHCKYFSQSLPQSKKDLEDAGQVFGTTKKSYKKYRMARHVDRIEDIIVKLSRESQWELLPKLYDTLTKAIAALPEDVEVQKHMPTMIFNFTQNNVGLTSITEEDAARIAQDRLRAKGVELDFAILRHQYDEAEEVADGDE